MTDFADIRKLATLPTRTVSLCLAGELAGELVELEQQYVAAGEPTSLGDDTRRRLREEIRAKRAEVQDATVAFKLRAMSATEFADFWTEMPAQDEGETDKAFEVRTRPFYAELVSRTVVEPAMTVDEVQELRGMIAMSTWNRLGGECLRLNNRGVDIPNSVAASDLTEPSEQT